MGSAVILTGVLLITGFLGTYGTASDDFILSAIETETGYICSGSMIQPAGFNSRYLAVDTAGNCVNDSLPPGNCFLLCRGTDSSLVSAMTTPACLILQAYSIQGELLWRNEYPEHSSLQLREMISVPSSGYLLTGFIDESDRKDTMVIFFDQNGIPVWELPVENSSATALCCMASGGYALSCLTDSGSVLYTVSSSGQILDDFIFNDVLIRDLAAMNEFTAAAAVEYGVMLLDSEGDIVWSSLGGDTREIYAVTSVSGGRLAAAGSVIVDGERRSYLAETDSSGDILWERSFGYGESFRSIFAATCADGGFLSAGAYVENGTYNSFLIRTDSLGMIESQGVSGEADPAPAGRLFFMRNPQAGSSIETCVYPCDETVTLCMRDMAGRLLDIRTFPPGEEPGTVSFSHVVPGTYLITACTDDEVLTKKVTVLR